MIRKVIARIFQSFVTSREMEGGADMGLAAGHDVVKGCHGAMTFESRPGKRTILEVCPQTLKEETPAVTLAPAELRDGSERVLVIDDEPLLGDALVHMLRRLGYEARATTSGAEALAVFLAAPKAIDVVITDLVMADMTGDMLAQQIKRIRPDVPVIACTGYSERVAQETFRAPGIDWYAMKPVLIDDLPKLIRRALGRWSGHAREGDSSAGNPSSGTRAFSPPRGARELTDPPTNHQP